MDWWLASFFLGAILSLFLPIVPDLFVLFLLLLFSLLFFYYQPLRISSGLLFGACWMLLNAFNYQNQWQKNNLNPLKIASTHQWIQGKVSSLHSLANPLEINNDKNPLRFNLNVTHINSTTLNSTIKIRLSWKKAKLSLQQGQIVQLKVKLKPAHGLANIGGFSYQTWLRSKGIIATGYVINHKKNKVIIAKSLMRQQLFNSYKDLLPKHKLSPLLLALGFGSRSELTQQLWHVLQITGTGHLIAISGLHIGLVATGSYFLLMLLIRFLPLNIYNHLSQFQIINIRYLVIIVSLGGAVIYGYLAGFSLPTIRALLMLSIYWLTRVLGIKVSITRWLLLTLFLLALITPFSLFTASFWLSVYAVTIIFLTLWRFKHTLSKGRAICRFIKGLLVIQLSLTLMLLPISAVFFQQVSLVSLFANIIAVPWMSFLSIPLCLLSILVMPISATLSQLLSSLCLASLQVIWHYLSYISTLEWAATTLASFHIQCLVLLGVLSCGILFFRLPIIFNHKYLTMLVLCLGTSFSALSLVSWNTSDEKEWQLVVFDVGQGLSVLIQRGTKAILYDTGAAYSSGFNMAEAVILPFLQHKGIKKLDKMIISHSDNDHAGGLTKIRKSIVINELIYNREQKTKDNICLQGKSFIWQDLHFKMLWPKRIVSKENDDSCVLLISDGKHSVLLTGDISKKVEAELLQQYPKLNTDILVVPHHGSKTSSSDVFLSTLKPAFAVVSAGYLNRWHMPVTEVVSRYQQHNIELLNSAELGQIIFNISALGISKQTYHRDLWPFWFAH